MNLPIKWFVRRLIFAPLFLGYIHLSAASQGALILCNSDSQCGLLGQCRETFKIDEKKKRILRVVEVDGQTAEIPLVNIKWSETVLLGEFREFGGSLDGVTGYIQFTFKRLSGDMERFDSIYRNSDGRILNQDELKTIEADRISRNGPVFGRIRETLIKYKCEKSATKF
jgi:hypothetical protein